MPLAWRLSSPDYATRLDGKGNIQRGARWNSPGRGVVYAASNLSLAVLESLVQLPAELRGNLPLMTAVQIDVPDDAPREEITRDQLPDDLAGAAIAARCRELGDAWLIAERSLALVVASVLVPQERNLLLNPAHPFMQRVRIALTEPFRFDARLTVAQP
jgi:RES domain-containing protein